MLSPEPSRGIRLLDEAGLLEIFFPELTALKGVDRVQGVKHKDNFYHTLTVLDTLSLYSQDLWLRWAALLHDIGKPATKKYIQGQGWTFYGHNHVGERLVGKIFNRLKLPQNEKMKYVEKDSIRNFQPPISGEEIIATFHLPPCKTIGDIKNAIKEAILDGIIGNNYEEAREYMFKVAKELGIDSQ